MLWGARLRTNLIELGFGDVDSIARPRSPAAVPRCADPQARRAAQAEAPLDSADSITVTAGAALGRLIRDAAR